MDLKPEHPTAVPLDVQRTDETGDVDMAQLEYNLSLTPFQRLEQHDQFREFALMVMRAGAKRHGIDDSTPSATE